MRVGVSGVRVDVGGVIRVRNVRGEGRCKWGEGRCGRGHKGQDR